MNPRPKKSRLSKLRKVGRVAPRAPSSANQRAQVRPNGAHGVTRPTNRRRDARALDDALPTQLERDTMLTPEWVAESVVQEVERFLKTDLPENFAERLAKRAYYLYPRHRHFKMWLNRPGNRGRENLRMFMRHWTAGWLRRDRSPLYRKLPCSFGNGQPLPAT